MGLLIDSKTGHVPDYYYQKNAIEKQIGRSLSNKEFEEKYLIINKGTGGLSDTGTSVFDPVLTETMIRWHSKEQDNILDMFAGGSVRGIVSERIGRKYTGVDLRPEQIAANEEQAKHIGVNPKWICGDSMNIQTLAPGEYDMILTCPPYGNLEVYSDDPADISNMEDDAFDEAYTEILIRSCALLKEDRFAIIVVGNYRDKNGFIRDLVGLTVRSMEQAGARYYNDYIIVTPCGSLPIRAGIPFKKTRKMGRTHQYCLVFCKGDPVRATERLGDVEIPNMEDYLEE